MQDISLLETIPSLLMKEPPEFCSAIFQRQCDQQCLICLYPHGEGCTKHYSDKYDLEKSILNVVRQLPKKNQNPRKLDPSFLHAGRILESWHIDILKKIRACRSDLYMGIVNNGRSFVELGHLLKKAGSLFNWIDISLDGTKIVHDCSRDPEKKSSFDYVIQALVLARELLPPDGEISTCFTISKANFDDIERTASFLFTENSNLTDTFCIAAMTPKRAVTSYLETSTKDMVVAWKQLVNIFKTYNYPQQKVFFRVFRYQDIRKIANVVGKKKFWKSFSTMASDSQSDGILEFSIGNIKFRIDGVIVSYYPTSLWPSEEIFIDADATYRITLAHKNTIEELRSLRKLEKYTAMQLTNTTNLKQAYAQCVNQWWKFFGKNIIQKEFSMLQKKRE